MSRLHRTGIPGEHIPGARSSERHHSVIRSLDTRKDRNEVDFPDPFGPMSPIRSPSAITMDEILRRACTPNVLLMFWQLMSDMFQNFGFRKDEIPGRSRRSDPPFFRSGGGVETFEGFRHGLAAELKSGMVNGEKSRPELPGSCAKPVLECNEIEPRIVGSTGMMIISRRFEPRDAVSLRVSAVSPAKRIRYRPT